MIMLNVQNILITSYKNTLLVFMITLLVSCGYSNNSSNDFAKQEKRPHISDVDYRPYNRRLIKTNEESGDVDIVVVNNGSEPSTDDSNISTNDQTVVSTNKSDNIDIDISIEDENKDEIEGNNAGAVRPDHTSDDSGLVKPDDIDDISGGLIKPDNIDLNEQVDSNTPTTGQSLSQINHCADSKISTGGGQDFISNNEQKAFELALYVTGSFEGKHGWQNITNNFDGQGISLGLFQQNLGQGSLQPLLIKAIERHPDILHRYFSEQQVESVMMMLDEWTSNKNTKITRITGLFRTIAFVVKSYTTNRSNQYRDSLSVNWALENLYLSSNKGKKFKEVWKTAWKSLAGDTDYIAIQQEAAVAKHKRALKYMKNYDTKTLASYLFFFDIVVQNGSMRGLDYTNSLAALDETEKLRSLLNTRVQYSRPEFYSDVMDRKSLIIDGVGVVHKTERNLKKEVCISNWSSIQM